MFENLKIKIMNSKFIEYYYAKYNKKFIEQSKRLPRKFKELNNSNRILFVSPNNFLKNNAGDKSYIFNIVQVLKSMGYVIDFFTTELDKGDFNDFSDLNSKYKLIDNIYIVHANTNDKNKKYTLSRFSLCSDKVIDDFKRLVNSRSYRYICVHYVTYMDLIKYSDIKSDTKVIGIMHDIMSINCYFYSKSLTLFIKDIYEELSLLNYCDAITCISYEEQQFLFKFFPEKEFYYLPHFLHSPNISLDMNKKEIDCLFIGFGNLFNLNSIIWFVDKVYPLLKTKPSVTICGKICQMIKNEKNMHYVKMQNYGFQFIDFVENLTDLYSKVKISLVPMFSGTGLKIKTVTSMAYNVPIVGTLQAVDGFKDKTENGCLVSDDEHVFAEYIDRLLQDEIFYKKTLNKIQEYFNKHFSYERNAKKLNDIFK